MKYIFFLLCVLLVASPILVLAQTGGGSVMNDINTNLKGLGAGAGYQTSSEGNLPQTVGRIINILLSILGVLFVVLMVYGGVLWMTSFGNEQKVTRAKNLIIDAVIGLVIILLAYAISSFIVGQLMKATTA